MDKKKKAELIEKLEQFNAKKTKRDVVVKEFDTLVNELRTLSGATGNTSPEEVFAAAMKKLGEVHFEEIQKDK